MIRVQQRYVVAASLLFLLEILIALLAHDKIIRPYAGDFLAIIFLYCLAQGLLSAAPKKVALGILLVSYLIESL